MDVMQALFGQRDPAYRCAAGFSDSPHLFYSGFKPDGEFFLLYQIGFGGVPARPIGDGPDCHCLFRKSCNFSRPLLSLIHGH